MRKGLNEANTTTTTFKKGIYFMKNTKRKALVIALAVCLAAIVSMGTLAWFTAQDTITNEFFIANSEDDPDEIFSVDVWEKTDPDGEKDQDGHEYPNILPGDDFYKEVNIENTGSYDQYIRATVTVSDASVWQAVFGTVYVPLTEIATDLSDDFTLWSVVYNADEDALIYVLYYDEILPAEGEDIANLFTNIHIPEAMDRFQAAELAGSFDITVVADAVQTKNVGANAPEAFATVGMEVDEGNYTVAASPVAFANLAKLVNSGMSFEGEVITLSNDIDLAGVQVTPIGTEANPFNGTFDGADYTISNLTMATADAEDVALFDYVGEGAVLKNLKFENVNITGKYAAALACDVTGASIENIQVLSGSVTAGSYGAGIVVFADGTTIKNCVNNVAVTADSWGAAGIGAWVTNAVVEGCTNNATIIGGNRAAGICGNFSGTMTGCTNEGDVTSTGSGAAGGMVGILSGVATFENCTNNGDVTTTADNVNASAAGIVGQAPSSKAITVKSCTNTGTITAEKSWAAGIGVSLYGGINAMDCVNDGAVNGGDAADGIVAAKAPYGNGKNTATNCTNNGVVSVG